MYRPLRADVRGVIALSNKEFEKIEEINLRQEKNLLVFSQIAAYLNNAPCTVTREIIEGITGGNKSYEDYAYASFMSDFLCDDESLANELFKDYYIKSVKRLDADKYVENPYYKNIKIPNKQIGKWTLGYQSYEPYEAFIRDDIIVDGHKEIPCVGYFDSRFEFPTVFENGVEWMAIKPNEIETMKKPIEDAYGNVLVYGLGLGYYPYMISLKSNVNQITVVERDESVIFLFNEYVLPQFEKKEKIKIVKSDAFEYAEKEMGKHSYDFVFTDLWHDVSDGVELYVKMKKHESKLHGAEFAYWIEPSLLSAVRVRIFEALYEGIKAKKIEKTPEEINKILDYSYLKQFVKKL